MSAGRVRAGGVFVEIGADARKFFAAITRVNKAIGSLGRGLVGGGGRLAAAGIGMAAPIVAAVRQGTRFENVLLGIRASTGATAAEIDRIKAASLQMSQALGVGPTEAAAGMLELMKAGMQLDAVLGGAGTAAIQFAKVGEMEVAQAAVVMSDAMNVFGVTGDKAANTLSAAADASSTSITQMAEAFSMSSAVAGLANQSIDDLSAALAILANNGVKGSDAGTSVKTMLMRLMAPAEDGAAALTELGLSTASFRGADGKMRPMVEIIGALSQAMSGLDQAAQDDMFRRIFGADAIRAASILSSAGVDGFTAMQAAMAAAMPVGEKFKVLMSGLAGGVGGILASLERLSIVISDAVGTSLASVVPFIVGALDGFKDLIANNKEAVLTFAKVAVGAIAIGGAMATAGYALQALSGTIGMVLRGFGLFSALANPILLVAGAVGLAVAGAVRFGPAIKDSLSSVAPAVQPAVDAIGSSLTQAMADAQVVFSDLYSTASITFQGIYDAIVAGDLGAAMDILWAGLQAGWLRGVEALMSYVDPWVAFFQNTFTAMGSEIAVAWESMWSLLTQVMNIQGALIRGALDNLFNGVAATMDAIEATARKAVNVAKYAYTPGELAKANVEVDREMAARAETRAAERPGMGGRVKDAIDRNKEVSANAQASIDAMRADAQATMQGRLDENQRRADERRAGVMAAEGRVTDLASQAATKRADVQSVAGIQQALAAVTSLSELGTLGQDIDALMQRNNLSAEQEQRLMDAYNAAGVRVGGAETKSTADQAAEAAANAGEQSQKSMTSIAGTFSSLNLGSQFGSTSVAERTARAAEETARGVNELVGQGGPRAAA